MTEYKNKTSSMSRLVLVLFFICLFTALLLGLVNYITKDRIAAINEQKTAQAMEVVLPAGSYTPLEYTGGDTVVKAVYSAEEAGYVVRVAPSGFGGEIDMVVGIDAAGSVTGISIVEMSETSGLGTNASKPSFTDQFIGAAGKLAVTKDGGEIDALTGATVTSRAVTEGVNSALNAVQEVN